MSGDLIKISSSALPESTRVAAFRGAEMISRPYQFDIFLLMQADPGDEIDLGDAVGAKAQLIIDRDNDDLPPFIFSGVFASVELLHELDGRSLVRAIMVPKLWELGLSRHSRMFTKQAIPDILKAILEDNGLTGEDYEMRLGSYATEEHVCQYRESDLDFISRWMEREGIYYFFEHGENGEKLILCDDMSYDPEVVGKPVRYHPQLGDDRSAGAAFRTFTCKHATLPGLVKIKDYNYAKPNLDVSGKAPVAPGGMAEVVLYGERFFTPADGKRLAKIRSEELLAGEVVYHAAGTRFHLRSGYTFELEDHPRGAFNTRYVATEVTHFGNQAATLTWLRKLLELPHDDVYFVDLVAIPAKTQFRAPSRTAWPRIYGFENGVVDGPADSEYAQIDDQGRYSVKFNFDESDLKQGNASTFVRMMQPHGGGIEGFHFPLRKNTEVVFSFLGGDPDRPVISGVVPNALTPSPVTSGNHTKNVIQTGGRNRLELEDQAGQQRVTLSTPYSNTYLRMGSPNASHELILHTTDNTLLDFGKNFDLKVGFNGGGSWTTDVKTDQTTTVHEGNHAHTVKAGTSTTTVQKDTALHVVEGNLTQDVDAGTMTTTVKKDTKLHVVEGNLTTDVDAGAKTTNVKKDYTVTVSEGNTKLDTQAGTTDILSEGLITIKSNSANVELEGEKVKMTSRADWTWNILGTKVSVTKGSTVDFKLSQATSFTLGMTNSVFVGIQNSFTLAKQTSVVVGKQTSVFIGGKESLTISDEKNISISRKMALEIGMSLTIAASIAIKLVPTKIDALVADLKQSASKVNLPGFKIVI